MVLKNFGAHIGKAKGKIAKNNQQDGGYDAIFISYRGICHDKGSKNPWPV